MAGDDLPAAATMPAVFRTVIASDSLAVRAALRELMAAGMMQDLSDDLRGAAEIVLAELLNNVVEHAYADYPGEIAIEVARARDGLHCEVVDCGRPMPGGQPPDPDLSPPHALPEGGFGWFLIRALSADLGYRRQNGRNEIRLRVPVAAAS